MGSAQSDPAPGGDADRVPLIKGLGSRGALVKAGVENFPSTSGVRQIDSTEAALCRRSSNVGSVALPGRDVVSIAIGGVSVPDEGLGSMSPS